MEPQLWLFFLLVVGVVLLPGLDMAFVLGSALVGGPRAGLAATAGIIAGGVCHSVMTALGVMAILKLMPALFNAMLLAGAAYIGWIGWSLLRSQTPIGIATTNAPQRSRAGTFRQGLFTSLLNPKAYVFMLAIFPQFIRPGADGLWPQVAVLWSIIAVTQLGIYGGMAFAGGGLRAWLGARPAAGLQLSRAVGLVLVATALYTVWAGWHVDF
jgi:threonine/homoserine/homoserine lactone efflux protein